MKRLVGLIGLIALLVLMNPVASMAVPAPVTIELVNPPPNGLLELDVGESYTFEIKVSATTPFILAMVLGDEYYPGRGVFFHGNDTAHHAKYALLHLTIKGKEATDFLPEGVAPAAIVAGVRFKGEKAVSERFDFNVRVVP